MTKLFIVNEKYHSGLCYNETTYVFWRLFKKLTKKGGVVSFVSCVIQRKLTTVVWDGVFVKSLLFF
jgi:hypothetical protein